ncbi:MAG: hypothetical protein JWM25_732 [Thermoleophilia bacterium]|nr:hypothetical protein [Thermoleophilia bacterium]MCZ4496149.1 hypothetical protein [Thermoleophilia bacterium]
MKHATKMKTLVLAAAMLLLAGCGEGDPGAIGPTGIDGGLSTEGQKQQYVESINGALTQLGSAQGEQFGAAVDAGNKKDLQVAALAWRQGGEQLKTLDAPKDAAEEHAALVKAVTALDVWNQRIVAAAPNKAQTRKLAAQAAKSPASTSYGDALCGLVVAGYEVVDPAACDTTPLESADGPLG